MSFNFEYITFLDTSYYDYWCNHWMIYVWGIALTLHAVRLWVAMELNISAINYSENMTLNWNCTYRYKNLRKKIFLVFGDLYRCSYRILYLHKSAYWMLNWFQIMIFIFQIQVVQRHCYFCAGEIMSWNIDELLPH